MPGLAAQEASPYAVKAHQCPVAQAPALRFFPFPARAPSGRCPQDSGSRGLSAFIRLPMGRASGGDGEPCHGMEALAQVEGGRHHGHHTGRHTRSAFRSA